MPQSSNLHYLAKMFMCRFCSSLVFSCPQTFFLYFVFINKYYAHWHNFMVLDKFVVVYWKIYGTSHKMQHFQGRYDGSKHMPLVGNINRIC